jgi:hypothetical protein
MPDNQQKHVEGEDHSWDIVTREGSSEIQVFRNFQTALKNAGFAIDHRSWRTKATLGYSSTIAVVTTTKRLSSGKK